MDQQSAEGDQPPSFVSLLSDRLRQQEGADTDLVAILEAHILVDTAAPDAVAQAKAAIVALATERASPVEPAEESENG